MFSYEQNTMCEFDRNQWKNRYGLWNKPEKKNRFKKTGIEGRVTYSSERRLLVGNRHNMDSPISFRHFNVMFLNSGTPRNCQQWTNTSLTSMLDFTGPSITLHNYYQLNNSSPDWSTVWLSSNFSFTILVFLKPHVTWASGRVIESFQISPAVDIYQRQLSVPYGVSWWIVAYRLKGEGLVWLIGLWYICNAAPWVQLFTIAGNGRTQNVPQYH